MSLYLLQMIVQCFVYRKRLAGFSKWSIMMNTVANFQINLSQVMSIMKTHTEQYITVNVLENKR